MERGREEGQQVKSEQIASMATEGRKRVRTPK
jgi:hypothetical protein